MKNVERWVLQINDYFTITEACDDKQPLACIGLHSNGEALEWWLANRHKYTTWVEVKDPMRKYYVNNYVLERSFNKIGDLKPTGTVEKDLNDIDTLNVYAKMPDQHLINIILYGITRCLCQGMAHYEDLCSDASKWKEKLLHIDF